jgi:hypothetical protein
MIFSSDLPQRSLAVLPAEGRAGEADIRRSGDLFPEQFHRIHQGPPWLATPNVAHPPERHYNARHDPPALFMDGRVFQRLEM